MKLNENIQSSQINKIVYGNDILIVTFNNGAVWAYEDVPYSVYSDMMDAPSKGHFLNAEIKPNYSATKLSI